MTLRHAEQWMDDQLQNWMAGKSESPELVRHVDFSAKELRKIQADAIRAAADVCSSQKRQSSAYQPWLDMDHNFAVALCSEKLHELANQLAPEGANQNEQHPE